MNCHKIPFYGRKESLVLDSTYMITLVDLTGDLDYYGRFDQTHFCLLLLRFCSLFPANLE